VLYLLACIAGVNGEGVHVEGNEGSREKGMPAIMTVSFTSLPTTFQVIQLGELLIQSPIKNRHVLFCRTDFMQEFTEQLSVWQ